MQITINNICRFGKNANHHWQSQSLFGNEANHYLAKMHIIIWQLCKSSLAIKIIIWQRSKSLFGNNANHHLTIAIIIVRWDLTSTIPCNVHEVRTQFIGLKPSPHNAKLAIIMTTLERYIFFHEIRYRYDIWFFSRYDTILIRYSGLRNDLFLGIYCLRTSF